MSEGPLLRAEEVAGVLSGNPDGPAAEPAPIGPQRYSLREPVAVPPAAEAGAKLRLEQLTAAIEGGLREQLGQSVSLTVDGFQQQRAKGALSAMPAPAWLLCFVGAGGGAALAVSADTGLALVERALGGPGAQVTGSRPPTLLESRVIGGLAAAVAPSAKSFLGSSQVQGLLCTADVPPSVAAAGETVGVGLLRIRVGEGERNGLLLVTAALLMAPGTAADQGAKAPGSAGRESGAPAASKLGPLAPLIERVRVEVRPVLRAGRVSVGELAQLTVGTVLRLDAAETTPFDLHVVQQPVFRGRIVRQGPLTVFSATSRRGRATDQEATGREVQGQQEEVKR